MLTKATSGAAAGLSGFLHVGIEIEAAKLANQQYKIRAFDILGMEVIEITFNEKGEIVSHNNPDELNNVTNGYDLIGASAFGLLVGLATAGFVAAAPTLIGAGLALGVGAAAAFGYSLIADERDATLEQVIFEWNDVKPTDVRFYEADGIPTRGLIYNYGFVEGQDEYAAAMAIMLYLKGDLTGGRISFHVHNDDSEQSDVRYHLYDGSVLERIAASAATGRDNHLN
ncbi:MAG: hypothetical protein MK052_11465 [Alphaproteobacteria bacterium]|nr:hypothetical protein [Alphaproteobacteria bacterium]